MSSDDARPKLSRGKKTISAMVKIYCDSHHDAPGLCEECNALLDYALKRLEKCPFGEDKPTCANCEIHCYQKDMRQRVTEVMRFAGPRMMTRHPILAIQHLKDSVADKRRMPERPKH